jgi:ABC-type glycerol-3-phosphate transport system substrate-binding protein
MRHVQRRSSSEKVRRVGLLGLRRGCVTLLAGLAALALVLAACAPEEEPDVADAPEDPEEPDEPDAPDEPEEFPHIAEDGVLQPHPETGFPSEPITIWQPFEPGSDDDVFNQQIARIAEQYSPVPIATDTQQMGPALMYELSDWLQAIVIG